MRQTLEQRNLLIQSQPSCDWHINMSRWRQWYLPCKVGYGYMILKPDFKTMNCSFVRWFLDTFWNLTGVSLQILQQTDKYMSYYGEHLGMHWRPWHSESSEWVKLKKTKHLYAWNNTYTLSLIVLHSDVIIWEMVSFGTALNRIVWENNKPQKQWTLVLKHQGFMPARTNEIRGFKFRRVSWQQKCLNSAFLSIASHTGVFRGASLSSLPPFSFFSLLR